VKIKTPADALQIAHLVFVLHAEFCKQYNIELPAAEYPFASDNAFLKAVGIRPIEDER
jgi:hypothetical protein